MAAPTRTRGGRGRTLAVGITSILALGLATGLLAEALTPARPGTEAAATGVTPAQQRDAETKQSLVAVSEAVETYYVTHSGALTLQQGHTEALLKQGEDVVATVKLADGTRIESFRAVDYSTWCVDAVNESGSGHTFSMSADGGIAELGCPTV